MLKKYFFSLLHTKPSQILALSQFKLIKSKPDLSSPPPFRDLNLIREVWKNPAQKSLSLLAPSRFRFLNEEHEIDTPLSWNHPSWKKLWLYNLHYFDDLNAVDAKNRMDWHMNLIHRWILENPPPSGHGWEPYPLSLRIVNWIKWGLAGNTITEKMRQSLAVQTRYLMRRLEYHLLGNHLLKNGVALIFSGAFFEGAEPRKWLEQGIKIISREIQEQILPDGGHFERSPMYHSIVLEDLLDLANLLSSPGLIENYSVEANAIREKASSMLGFLNGILNPDGSIPLFNDSAYGIASSPRELFSYAERIGLKWEALKVESPVMIKRAFGFYRLKGKKFQITIDCGAIGPDYLPGHAHCDTLSYELWMNGHPLVVDTGTFEYSGPRRMLDRSTHSHNTVMIDGEEQHEIWKEHRVARRGYPLNPDSKEREEGLYFEGGHNGYRRLSGSPLHWRSVEIGNNGICEIKDRVTGEGIHRIESFVHFHPEVKVELNGFSGVIHFQTERIALQIENITSCYLEDSYYCPEFGKKIPNKTIRMVNEGKLPLEMNYRFC